MAAILVVAWTLVVAIDLVGVAGVADAMDEPAWYHLFNDRPVEWMQWILLGAAIIVNGYLAGRLRERGRPGPAAFFLVFGVGLALMLLEEAGDIRHVISKEYMESHVGPLGGLSPRVYIDLPYFALLATVPLYAVIRYGRFVWRVPSVRPYLVTGVVLYGLVALGSGLRHLDGLYVRLGRAIDRAVLGGRWGETGSSPDSAHFFLLDGGIEESLELIAAACVLCVALAFATDAEGGRVSYEAAEDGRLV